MPTAIDMKGKAALVTGAFLASPAGRSYHGAVVSIDKGITAG